jgi:peptidoglycan/LPS O-acetylase OafA/YrhL
VISYSLYVWQGFVFALVGGLPGVAVAVLVAMVSYRYIERPFRRYRATRAAATEQSASGLIAVPA